MSWQSCRLVSASRESAHGVFGLSCLTWCIATESNVSVCFQVPAVTLEFGVTIVLSPLVGEHAASPVDPISDP